jgi:hypothetical protein
MSKGNHKKGKGKGKHHRGLGALDTMKKEAANPGMYFLGFLTSALIAKAVDKALPVVQDGDGKFKAKEARKNTSATSVMVWQQEVLYQQQK